mgnify:CR=1 FL=1
MYKEPNLNKELHPHLYEYRKLGESTTEEGKEYETKYMDELLREIDRKSTRLNSSHIPLSRMPSSA